MRIKKYLDLKNYTASALDGRVRFTIRRLLPVRRPTYVLPEAAPKKAPLPT